jgi:hypothetical protein
MIGTLIFMGLILAAAVAVVYDIWRSFLARRTPTGEDTTNG